jgi:hypothetical protein
LLHCSSYLKSSDHNFEIWFFSCEAIAEGLFYYRHLRHEIASEGVVQVLRSGGFNPKKNAKVCCLGSNNEAPRPADILSDGDRIGSQICIDVTVVSNMCASFPKPHTVGKAALEADKKKYIKHKEACEKADFGFQAFAIDTSGVLRIYIYVVLLLPMLLLLIDPTRMLLLSVLDVLVLLYKRGWPTS